MLYIILKLFLLLCCVIKNKACANTAKWTFKDTVVLINYDGLGARHTIIFGCISPDTIPRQPSEQFVKGINCKYENIPIFYEKAVSNLPNLVYLLIENSQTQEIQDNAFYNLPKLYVLSFYQNEITSIHKDSFKNLPSLKYLELEKNKIAFLEAGIFHGIYKLILNHNKLGAFEPEWFSEPDKVHIIYIENNLISSIQKHALQSFGMLETISFRFNQIHYIHKEAFMNASNLRELVLDNNKITTLHWDTFQHLPKLTELQLHKNHFTYISDKILTNLSRKSEIGNLTICENPWQCGCFDMIWDWAQDNYIGLQNGDCNERNPVCVIPEEDEEKCLEHREENLELLFYTNLETV